jgi:aspartate racemase
MRGLLHAQRSGPAPARRERGGPLLASLAQQRLWFLETLSPGSAVHNQTVAYRLVGDLVPSALEYGLGEIVRRHEALRTTLSWSDGRLLQQIHPSGPFLVESEDLRGLAEDARAVHADDATRRHACTPLDIDRVPLLRAKLFRLADREHRLVVTMHHLAFDGWSFQVFMRELCALYSARINGQPAPLPELPFQYADWAAWQRERLTASALAPLLEYWKREMAPPLPVLGMPVDHTKRSIVRRRGRSETLVLPQSLTAELKLLAERCGTTTYMLLLAGFQALLRRYTGDEEVVVGSPAANRHMAGSDALIGLLVNTFAIRTRFAPRQTFRELLAAVRASVLGAYEHQELPFETLVQAVAGTSRIDTTPLFQAMFAFQNPSRTAWTLPGVAIDAWNVDNGAAKFDLTLFMWDRPEGFGGLLEYDADRYEPLTARQWLRHLRMLLEGIARDPNARIATLPLLDDDERSLVISGWNDPRAPVPRGAGIHELFAQRVREQPDAVALRYCGGTMTYVDLERGANRLARVLRKCGVTPGDRVGICMRRSPSLITALLATLKAGAAYVAIDVEWPRQRIETAFAGVRAIVTDDGAEGRFATTSTSPIVDVQRERAAIDAERDNDPAVHAGAGDMAYVVFTSGSTGVPKGVCIPHRGVVRLAIGANYARVRNDDVLVQLSPIAFDASTFEIWGALLNGATLAVPPASRLSLDDIGDAIEEFGATIAFLSTGLFEAMVDSRIGRLARLRQLLVGGEVLSPRHAERMLREVPGCCLVNCYGPTENTTFSTFHRVDLADCVCGESIAIGRPVSNTRVYVLDGERQPVPIGVFGEAYLAGDGVMIGYLDDPAGTKERLSADAFSAQSDQALYRSGDVVRWRRDGTLEFRGRYDDQVKVRGYRVEPHEIELALDRCPIVARAAVMTERDPQGHKRLVCCATLAAPGKPSDEAVREIRDYARTVLPDYLVPSRYVVTNALPLDGNGKLDRARLLSMPTIQPPAALDAPRDDRERALTALFERSLGVRPIAPDDDFFDNGGTSLSALTLVAEVEDMFSVVLPLASLYENATPAKLAAWLASFHGDHHRSPVHDWDSMLVDIRRGSGEIPLFLVPGGHGGMAEMTLYAKVLSQVRYDMPVYGLLAQGVDGCSRPHGSVAEMASAYVARVRRHQPEGPYAIAGECVGGLIALEMAQRLVDEGDDVALLLLLDTWCPTLAGVLHYRYVERTGTLLAARGAVARRGVADVRRVWEDHVRNRPPFGPLRTVRYAVNVLRTLARVAKPWVAATYAVGRPAKGGEAVAAAEANYVERAMRYRPRRYSGRIMMIACADNERRGIATPWRELASGGFELTIVPGDHETYLRETPHQAAVLIERYAREAAAQHASSRRRPVARARP